MTDNGNDERGACALDNSNESKTIVADDINILNTPCQKQKKCSRLPRRKTTSAINLSSTNNADTFCENDTLRRSSVSLPSDSELKTAPPVRETIASKIRQELTHGACDNETHNTCEYVSPLQKKEQLVRELKSKLKDLQKTLDQRETWWQEQALQKEHEFKDKLEEKNERIAKLTREIELLKENMEESCTGMNDAAKTISCLEVNMKKLQNTIEEKEKHHQQLYLEMYLKGKNAAIFERMEEIERLAIHNPQSVTIRELLEKLVDTEHELEKWQKIRRDETYHAPSKPETQAEVTLPFLRDAMFHYLTDGKDRDDHLRAMIEIFDYTDTQRKKIHTAMIARKKGK